MKTQKHTKAVKSSGNDVKSDSATVVADPLTGLEKATLRSAEKLISRGLMNFYEVGTALKKVRDGKLYRQKHKTFEDYMLKRWAISRSPGYRFISAAELKENLSSIGDRLPVNEAQARPLLSLKPEQQRKVWKSVIKQAATSKDTKLKAWKIKLAVQNHFPDQTNADAQSADPQRDLPPVHDFINGDCSAIGERIKAGSARLLIINTDFHKGDHALETLAELMCPDCIALVISTFDAELRALRQLDENGFVVHDRSIYYPTIESARRKAPIARHRSVLVTARKGVKVEMGTIARLPDPIIEPADRGFPGVPPVKVMRMLIDAFTNEGDTVIIVGDRYAAGVIAARQSDRSAVSIEREEGFYHQGRARIEDAFGSETSEHVAKTSSSNAAVSERPTEQPARPSELMSVKLANK